VDTPEALFQNNFHDFCTVQLQLPAQNNAHANVGNKRGRPPSLDHFVNDNMGVEFLIRSSENNKMPAGFFSLRDSTWDSLLEHSCRAATKYTALAQKCTRGYVTVLVASLSEAALDAAWEQFQDRMMNWTVNHPQAVMRPIVVAVAPFGWGKWCVFLHRLRYAPLRLEVKRQWLFYKLIGSELMSARMFYPRPTSVWVRHMRANLSFIAARADKVKPLEDDITSLASAICQHFGIVSRLAWITRWPAGICPADTFLRCVFAARSCPVHV
jgi:hypothetical protein